VQACESRYLVLAPPAAPLTESEMDFLYSLPFRRQPHPSYQEPIPALKTVQFSLTSHRGCGGGCTFCSLALHQGRHIQSRSSISLAKEAKNLTRHRDWRGSLADIGGPTANLWSARCIQKHLACTRSSCLFPSICRNLQVDMKAQIALLRMLRRIPGVKHMRVASGIRHDLALQDNAYLTALTAEFVGGQIKIAPEHCSSHVLRLMRKPDFVCFERFLCAFTRASTAAGKEQYVVPYFMSAFPGCSEEDMRALAAWLRQSRWRPQQVQCFIPTPGTVASAMYYAEIDPAGRRIYVAKSDKARRQQHNILLGRSGKNSALRAQEPMML